jgi:hypothetical protein
VSDPDWDKLREIHAKLEELADAGRLTKDEFQSLLDDAEKAVGEHEEFLESILMRGMELGFIKR